MSNRLTTLMFKCLNLIKTPCHVAQVFDPATNDCTNNASSPTCMCASTNRMEQLPVENHDAATLGLVMHEFWFNHGPSGTPVYRGSGENSSNNFPSKFLDAVVNTIADEKFGRLAVICTACERRRS